MDDLTPNNGHNDGGYDNNGYDNNGYNNGGYDNSGYNNNGYNNNGYNNGGYDNNGYNNGGYNNYGYGNNGGGYFPDGPFRGMYDEDNDFPEPQKGSGFAIASFVISLINLVICGTLLSIITVPLCLIFSVVSLAGRRKGAVFAVIGIIISLVSAVFFAFAGYIFYKITPDFIYFLNNAPQTGTVLYRSSMRSTEIPNTTSTGKDLAITALTSSLQRNSSKKTELR